MGASRVGLAALNNALWYDTIFRAHGMPGEMLGGVWLSRSIPPPFHSNLVVVSERATESEVLARIHDLMKQPPAPHWTVKDSYFILGLEPLGFDVLFNASWIWLDPDRPAARKAKTGLRWTRVWSPDDAAQWEAAWRGHSDNQHTPAMPRQFPQALFADPDFAFFLGTEGRDVTAGGIAHRTQGVVGISNAFIHAGEPADAWAGLSMCIHDAFPGLPVVGYLRDDELQAAIDVGFERIGLLRVWQRRG
jgi:hypothetical protein